MNVHLPPELDEFVSEQARLQGYSSAEEYVEALVARERERSSRDWNWLRDHLRPGYEAADEELVTSSPEEVIARGRARKRGHSPNG